MQGSIKPLSPRTARPHAITLALVAMQLQWMPAAWGAAPAQMPLISRDSQPAPNVMLTLDTSWSMIFPYIPEGKFSLPGGDVTFPSNNSPILHPDDNRFDQNTGRRHGDGGVIPGDPSDTAPVLQYQMRSPDVNALYYDPRVQYKPWLISIGATGEVRYPNAIPSKAYFDPNDTSTYADLTAAVAKITANWCTTTPEKTGAQQGKLDCGGSLVDDPKLGYTSDQRLALSQTTMSFSPGLYYLLDGASASCPKDKDGTTRPDPNFGPCYTKFDINAGTSFTRYPNRNDCSDTVCTQDQERQNFANWFVYYRTRLHMAQAAIPESFHRLDNDKIRVGWATIHKGTTTVDGRQTSNVIDGVRLMNDTRKTQLSDWIRNYQSTKLIVDSSPEPKLSKKTPLRSALVGVGDYFSRTDANGPWATSPGTGTTSPALACRRAYNVLMTDGYYTDETTTVGDVDGTATATPITSPDGKSSFTYTPKAPYTDNTNPSRSNTLADVAMKYWVTDLNGDLDNKVPAGTDVPGRDPAFWQHLVQLPIGLGITGSVPNDSVANQVQYVTQRGWWSAADGNMQKVDDLLHAAMNSRGQFFSAKKPGELTSALTSVLNRASRQDGLKQSGLATAVQSLGGINVKYVPEYTTEQWFGDVVAYASDASGRWIADPKWNAANHLPEATNRNIVTMLPRTDDLSPGINFKWPTGVAANDAYTLDLEAQNLLTQNLPTTVTGDDLVNYLRGDSTLEDTATDVKTFRQRENKLGDFVNSTPLVLKGNVNLFYDLLPADKARAGEYTAFLKRKADRTRLIFAGANDGMLHAFADPDDNTCAKSGVTTPPSCGQEVFAYIPRAALPKLSKLAKRDYGGINNPHQFLVDGPLTESDAYLPDGSPDKKAWKNVLIGTMGAGGRTIFALDVTPGTTLGRSSVMWEKSNAEGADFGYMMGDAQVGVLPDGSWMVFVGNGPYSEGGKASLMMIELKSGNVTPITTNNSDTANGLGAVRLVKDSTQQVIGAYAGDLKGTLWYFDLSQGVTKAQAKPIFTASNSAGATQPITAAPSVMPHPKGGYMVTFGTGKLFDDTDSDDTTMQTMYGVWHKPASSTQSETTPTRANLVEQNIRQVFATDSKPFAAGRSYYTLDFHDVNYAQSLGWFIDLNQDPGQRVIYPQTSLKNFVLFNTIVPVTTEQAQTCENKGKGYGWVLPVLMDGTYNKSLILDTSGDGVVSSTSDAQAFGFSTDADGRDTVLVGGGGKFSDQHTGKSQEGQIPGNWKRVWRQLISSPQP